MKSIWRTGVACGGFCVNYYRLYMKGAANGRFIGFQEIVAVDDIVALREAEKFVGQRPLELWCRSRRVRSFPAA